jgi:signal transduction histidine kinase
LTPKDVIGKSMLDFITPEFREMVKNHYIKRLRGEEVENRYEFSVIGRGEKILPVENNSSFIIFDGRPATISILRDISRFKEVEKIKSDFISVASHQLRNPLTGIKWFSKLLLDQKVGSLSKEQTDFIKQIYDSNERMIRLTNDLLEVSHIENGTEFKIEKKPGKITELIRKVIKDQKINFPEKNVRINIENSCLDKMVFDFDESKIYEVISNLISNSIKYSNSDAEIIVNVKAECLDKEVKVTIEDFGLGIPISQQKMIFQKFFRAENILGISIDGTGLGLYIAKGMIEAHGGKIWFESEQDKGTRFYFTLPLENKRNDN